MIDLHLHTTASDGLLTPAELVARASAAGLTTISVTDHDTVAALKAAEQSARALGIRLIPGIEITAVDREKDIHVLGYFFDSSRPALLAFLEQQRAQRIDRIHAISARLSSLGAPIEVDGLLAASAARPGSSIGRPQLARALVEAGHVESVQEAFDRWLATGMPAFVPRTGPSPSDVVDLVHDAGGVASFAHPGVTARDDLIAPLASMGLDALEVFHSDHSPEQQQAYAALARRLGLAVSGGSDFHGEPVEGPTRAQRVLLGRTLLPLDDFKTLEIRAHRRSNRL